MNRKYYFIWGALLTIIFILGIAASGPLRQVIGPSSTTENSFLRWDSTIGIRAKSSQTIEDNDGNVSIGGNLNLNTNNITGVDNITSSGTVTAGAISTSAIATDGSGTNDISLPLRFTDLSGNSYVEQFGFSGSSTNGVTTTLWSMTVPEGYSLNINANVNAYGYDAGYSDILNYQVARELGGSAEIVRTNHLWSLTNHWIGLSGNTVSLSGVSESGEIMQMSGALSVSSVAVGKIDVSRDLVFVLESQDSASPMTDSVGTNHFYTANAGNFTFQTAGKVRSYSISNAVENASYTNATVPALTSGQSFTVAGWFNANSGLSGSRYPIGRWNTTDNTRSWHIRYFPAESEWGAFYSTNGTADIEMQTTFTATAGTWHYVVLQFDNTNDLMKMSVDGGDWQTQAFTGSLYETTSAATLRIGAAGAGSSITGPFQGKMEQIAYWTRAIGIDEVRHIYNSGNGRAYANW